jgi:hypothetical protein
MLALVSAAGVVACGDSIGQGAEFVKDSWASPTDHGELEFGGASNPGEFTEEERFHAWTFSLSDDADVVLEAKLATQNLESVLYLYKKQEDGNWGSYISKNDDADSLGLGSRVKKALDAGEYKIKVKAAKKLMTGSFSVGGTCAGAGCPSTDDFCGPEDDAMPDATGYSKSCATKLHKILTTPVGHSAPQCLADKLEERAIAYYVAYWNDVYSWEEMSEGQDPYVSVTHHSDAGTIVGVGLGGDEDSMDYVFDAEGELVFYYQHNQSPDWAWFCEGPVDENVDPGDECATEVSGGSDYRLEDTSEGEGSVDVSNADSLAPHVAAAVNEYAAESSLGADATVSYTYFAWDATYNVGAEVKLSAAGAEVRIR